MSQADEQEPAQAVALRAWAEARGAKMHRALYFRQDADGMSVYTSEELPPDTPVISAPFALAITPEVSLNALQEILGEDAELSALSERELVCTYVAMHWIAKEVDLGASATALDHGPYVDSLPPRTQLRTPLHFTPEERALLTGTNMASATTDREADWRTEWERCRAALGAWGAHLTWDHYLTASTHLSCRAFPSTLLSAEPSLASTPTSHPVLIPLIDSLNHARAHPVSWSVSPSPSPSLSIVQHKCVKAGAEVLNNYGAKPNAELLLGYGFALENNPDDTLVLRVGGAGAAERREVGRGGGGMQRVLFDVLGALAVQTGGPPAHAHAAIPLEYDGAFVLAEMLEARLEATPVVDGWSEEGVRPEVRRMLRFYVQGQRDILQDAIKWAREKIEEVAERAAELGIDLGEDEEDDSG